MSMTENVSNFDVKVNVYGGGSTGQAEAVRMALRVMCEVNAENRAILKPEGLLTRDPRMVERKKFGQKKARKRFHSLNVNIQSGFNSDSQVDWFFIISLNKD
jgi:small subunit ribosomal protein S9